MNTLITKIISQRFLSITSEDLQTATPEDLLTIIIALDDLLKSPSYMKGDTVKSAQKIVDIMGQINAFYQFIVEQTSNPDQANHSNLKQTKVTEILTQIKQIADFKSQK